MTSYRIENEHQRQQAIADIRNVSLPASLEITRGTRTLKQNAALHVWLGQLAAKLNEAGLDMRAVLKPGADIPWTAQTAKDHLWRPIQNALTGKESTADASRVEYGEVEEVLCRHLAEKLGIQAPPWPKKDAA